MHVRESKQKLVAAAFIRMEEQEDESQAPVATVALRQTCDCSACMENHLRMFLLMCLQMATVNELDFEAVLQDARNSIDAPTYIQ